MLPRYLDYIFMHQRQKARLIPELRPKIFSTLGLNQTQKAGPTYNSETHNQELNEIVVN